MYLKFDEQQIKYIKKKIIPTCIRASYYVSCQRNKDVQSRALKILNDIEFLIFVNLYNPNIFQVVADKLHL